MVGAVALPTTAATGISIAAAELIPAPWGQVVTIAAVCTALTVIAHFTHAREVLVGLRNFLRDWHGEPARPGVEPRPSMPERITRVEQRITDHRERNEQTIRVLQEAVDALGQDRLIVETARAIITELGHDADMGGKP